MNKKPTEGQLLAAMDELAATKNIFTIGNANWNTLNAFNIAISAIKEALEYRAQQATSVMKITVPEYVSIKMIGEKLEIGASRIQIDASQTGYKWHPQRDDTPRQKHLKRAFPRPDNAPLPESVMIALKRVASLSIAIRNARHPDKLINSLDSAEAALVAEIDSHASTICGKSDEGGGNGTNYY